MLSWTTPPPPPPPKKTNNKTKHTKQKNKKHFYHIEVKRNKKDFGRAECCHFPWWLYHSLDYRPRVCSPRPLLVGLLSGAYSDSQDLEMDVETRHNVLLYNHIHKHPQQLCERVLSCSIWERSRCIRRGLGACGIRRHGVCFVIRVW